MLLFWAMASSAAYSQGNRKVIQLTGVIAAGDSLLGIPGASVVIPKAGRGTQTNEYGFFSLPVLAGDSVVFSSLGFAKQTLIIPRNYERDSYSVIIEMLEDPNVLPEIRVFPYATYRDFTQAVLATKLPDDNVDRDDALSEQILNQMFRNTPMDANANFRYNQQLQQQQIMRRGGYNPLGDNPLFNPFNWAKVINDLKKKK